ncbi:hypothetical protein MTO96_038519 [Rhipicephalus appendiculatus]
MTDAGIPQEAVVEINVLSAQTQSCGEPEMLPSDETGSLGLMPGLGTMNGDTWKLNRRFCMHTLRDFGMGKSYAMKDIVEEFQRACSQIAKAEGEPVAFYDYIISCAFNNILAIVFGRRCPYDHPTRADINRLVNGWLAAIRFCLRNQYNPTFVMAITKRLRGTKVNLAIRKVDDLCLYV